MASVTMHLALEHGSMQTKSTVWIVTVLRSSHANNLQLLALSEAWKVQEMGPSERKLGQCWSSSPLSHFLPGHCDVIMSSPE